MPGHPTRRAVIRALAGGALGTLFRPYAALAGPLPAVPLARAIPSTGEKLPVVGLGTWITFNVGDDPVLRDESAAVMRAFFEAGGRVIDSSPMYGSSQEVVGYGLAKLGRKADVFAADKVWIGSGDDGPAQIEESRGHWGVRRFDLLQVHNLLAWEEHLPRLLDMKAGGKVRYVGITTSEGRRHEEIEQVLATRPVDFVQVSYNVLDREVERRILPLAREQGIAVLINRPFRQGALTRDVERHPLPAFAAEIGASTWAQLLLKFIISHPAVTCVIPATTSPEHARENVAAATGELPDEAMRRRIVEHVERL
ncbi:MAG TPA: aldo/keto reductase [Gemmatimonadales bacterium]